LFVLKCIVHFCPSRYTFGLTHSNAADLLRSVTQIFFFFLMGKEDNLTITDIAVVQL